MAGVHLPPTSNSHGKPEVRRRRQPGQEAPFVAPSPQNRSHLPWKGGPPSSGTKHSERPGSSPPNPMGITCLSQNTLPRPTSDPTFQVSRTSGQVRSRQLAATSPALPLSKAPDSMSAQTALPPAQKFPHRGRQEIMFSAAVSLAHAECTWSRREARVHAGRWEPWSGPPDWTLLGLEPGGRDQLRQQARGVSVMAASLPPQDPGTGGGEASRAHSQGPQCWARHFALGLNLSISEMEAVGAAHLRGWLGNSRKVAVSRQTFM